MGSQGWKRQIRKQRALIRIERRKISYTALLSPIVTVKYMRGVWDASRPPSEYLRKLARDILMSTIR